MVTVSLDIPDWVSIPTCWMGRTYKLGKVVRSWRNGGSPQIQVEWYDSNLKTHLGQYGVRQHSILPMPPHPNEKYEKYLAKCSEETQQRCRDFDAKIQILLNAMSELVK